MIHINQQTVRYCVLPVRRAARLGLDRVRYDGGRGDGRAPENVKRRTVHDPDYVRRRLEALRRVSNSVVRGCAKRKRTLTCNLISLGRGARPRRSRVRPEFPPKERSQRSLTVTRSESATRLRSTVAPDAKITHFPVENEPLNRDQAEARRRPGGCADTSR